MTFGSLALIEMAAHRIANLRVKIGKAVGLGENRFSEGAGRVPTLGRLLY